jgi:2'-5' RNA ligase
MRAFVAINLPAEVRGRLHEAARPLRDMSLPVRWVSPEGLHLTLKFLGGVADDRAGELAGAIEEATAGHGPFPMELAGFGAFPKPSRPRVLWAGVEPDDRLTAVQSAVESAMAEQGFEPEGRAFHPHVTLGRARRDASGRKLAAVEGAIAELEHSDRFEVTSVDLMRSELRPGGARYEVVRAVELGG